jgi:thioredoxin reductase (NADPH)
VRGPDVAASMSDYLIEELRSTRNVDIRHRAQVVGGAEDDGALCELEIARLDDGTTERVPAGGLFVFIGSTPNTGWLGSTVQRDTSGFVRVGSDINGYALSNPERRPRPLETSVAGVFAIGDARRGSIKRVATAVGDGAAVVQMVHEHLADSTSLDRDRPTP